MPSLPPGKPQIVYSGGPVMGRSEAITRFPITSPQATVTTAAGVKVMNIAVLFLNAFQVMNLSQATSIPIESPPPMPDLAIAHGNAPSIGKVTIS